MGHWIDILHLASKGESQAARQVLNHQLPLALRDFAPSSVGSRRYLGPVPEAVSNLIRGLPREEGLIARSFAPDLIDAIVDEVVAGVEKPLMLVELCRRRPVAAVEELTARFKWPAGLKRSTNWKREWVSNMLRSMDAKDIELPRSTIESLGGDGRPVYEFNEIAYAVAPKRILNAWRSFKREQSSGSNFQQFDETSEGIIADEMANYSSVRAARIILGARAGSDTETLIDLHRIGARVGPALTALVEEFHSEHPADGYRLIASHCVFWNITSDYEGLRLQLDLRRPFLERDGELAEFLSHRVAGNGGMSRQSVQRRRTRLESACLQIIRDGLVKGI